MSETKVYGASDDLIEFEGEFSGEAYGGDEPSLVVLSDGTLLTIEYGDEGIWKIKLVKKGGKYERIEQCDDCDARPHSDIAYFSDGIKWVYVASKWEKVS